jgi:hypothetical protein
MSRANTVSDAASKAMSQANSIAGGYIYSLPGAGSRAVHEIVRTSAGLLKIVYSSVAS